MAACLGVVAVQLSPYTEHRAAAQDARTLGQWSSVQQWPVVSVHSHLLPTGQVMFYPYSDDVHLWDPATGNIFRGPLAGYNLFCTGHSFLADGRLLVTGGHISNEVGLPNTSIYDPFSNTWTRLPEMNAGRWYPTNTTLANGDVLVVSGTIDRTVWVNPLPQVWQVASGAWRDLVDAQTSLPLYPFMYLAPNGRVFNAGPNQASSYLDTAGTGAWTPVADSNFGLRDYGSSVLYDTGKVLIVGGGDPPTNTAEVIDLTGQPSWRQVSPMSIARRHLNATLLPDGMVLVTGGTSGPGFNNASTPVFATELWDPATDTWTTLAPAPNNQFRGYHSTALLLPDGRVLSSGGDEHPTAEIYSPPYLFNGARPAITGAPARVGYGEAFAVNTPDAGSIELVTLLRLSSVTHAFNMEQRIVRPAFSTVAGGLSVIAPSDPNVAPPGYYMLFILNDKGVPSTARVVRIR